jgi:hypothetical protein
MIVQLSELSALPSVFPETEKKNTVTHKEFPNVMKAEVCHFARKISPLVATGPLAIQNTCTAQCPAVSSTVCGRLSLPSTLSADSLISSGLPTK